MAFCGFLWVLEMNAIALALTGLNPPQPDQRRLRRHHGAAGHFGGETFPPHIADGVDGRGRFLGMIRTSNEEVAEPSMILLTHFRKFLLCGLVAHGLDLS